MTGVPTIAAGPRRGKGRFLHSSHDHHGRYGEGAEPPARRAEELYLNPFEPGFFDNPYDQYRRLRELRPVHQSPLGPWTLTRYDDVSRLVRDPSLSVEERNATFDRRADLFPTDEDGRQRGSLAILNLDPPDHTRIRRLVSKAFTPRRVETLLPRVQALVDEMLDGAERNDDVDVIRDLAFPLPFAVISEMLGMPESDRDQLRGWSHTLVRTLEPLTTADDVPELLAASNAMIEHVTAAIEWKRSSPADDLLTAARAQSPRKRVTASRPTS